MPRVKRGTKRRHSRKKTLALAKGFFLTKSKLYRAAQEAVEKSLRYGYKGRRLKKRDFRSLWIVRIGAGCRVAELSYSRFMDGLKKAGVDLNRKVLVITRFAPMANFKLDSEKIEGDIATFIDDYIKNVARVFGTARTKIEVQNEHPGLKLRFNPIDVSIVVDNLVSNSRRAKSSRVRDRKSTRLNSSHIQKSRMPSSA